MKMIKSMIELSNIDFCVSLHSAVPQKWANNAVWYGYSEAPRPNCGFIYIAHNITADFTDKNGNTVTARKGELVYVPEGVRYTVRFKNLKDVHGETYTVNFRIVDQNGNRIMLSDKIEPIFIAKTPAFETKIKEICEQPSDINSSKIRLNRYFLEILDYIATELRSESKDYYPIRAGIEQLSKEWNLNEHIGKYAAMCSVSESYFYLLFRKAIGVSPVEFRNKIRIINAKALLKNSQSTIAEIAESVGFEDQFFFSRVFKKYTGISPAAYRIKK